MRALIQKLSLIWLVSLFFSTLAVANDKALGISYYDLGPPSLTANLTSGGRYFRIDAQLMTEDPSGLAEIELHAAALRHSMILLMGEQDGESLKSPEGKKIFHDLALKELQDTMRQLTGKKTIHDVFFTSYLVK